MAPALGRGSRGLCQDSSQPAWPWDAWAGRDETGLVVVLLRQIRAWPADAAGGIAATRRALALKTL